MAGIQAASAATFTVDSTGDTSDQTADDGFCGNVNPITMEPVAGTCTFRAAIQEANSNNTADTITFSVASTTLSTALDPITKPVTITGPTGRFMVDGDDGLGGNVALLRFTGDPGTYAVSNLILQNGETNAAGGGGGLYFAPTNTSTLVLTDVDILDNVATAGPGGGLAIDLATSGSAATLTRVRIAGNQTTSATMDGGGFWARVLGTSTITVTESTIAGNTSARNGGGLAVQRGRVNLSKATVGSSAVGGNNTAAASGGGIYLGVDSGNGGSVALENVTIANNTATGGHGGGIGADAANTAASRAVHTTIARNTATAGNGGGIGTANSNFPGDSTNPFTSNIVAENTATAVPATNNCWNAFNHASPDSGYNASNDVSCNFVQSTDKTLDVTWLDDTLSDNLGTTQTLRLTAGTTAEPNTAIDGGNPTYARTTDQRGAPTVDGDASGSSAADIGAYEFAGYGAIQFTTATFTVREDGTPANIGVQRFGGLVNATSAEFSTTAGTAPAATGVASCPGTPAANADYENVTNATVAFATGQADPSAAVDVVICGDPDDAEPDENVGLLLENAAQGSDLGARSTATLQIQDVDEGTLQFSAATFSAAENAGTVNMTIGVTRTSGTTDAVQVDYAITGGTADDGVDYTDTTPAPTGKLSWGDTVSTTQFIVLTLNNDAQCELDETVTFQLSNPTNGARLGTQATSTFTITDDDGGTSAGTIQFDATSYSVNETASTKVITVRRVGGCSGGAAVDIAVIAGSATTPQDYVYLGPSSLSWGDGESQDQTLSVNIVDDGAIESDQKFTVDLTAQPGTTVAGTDPVPVTIVSNEQPRFRFTAANFNVIEPTTGNTVQANLTVEAQDAYEGEAVTLDYATGTGTATAGTDYTAENGSVTWAAGTTAAGTTQTFNVLITGDSAIEGNETFPVTLSVPAGGTGGGTISTPNPATVTIVDPASVQFAASTFTSANETNGSIITVTVERLGGTSGTIDVTASIVQACSTPPAAGCAGEAVDYTRAGGFSPALHWDDGDGLSKTFTITVLGDTAIEGNENISLQLGTPTGTAGAVLAARNTATATITDDDYRLEMVDVSPLVVGEAAGNATVTVRRFGSTVGAASVEFATADGSATAGSDYTATASPPALSWTAGEGGTKTIMVPVTDDAVDEGASEDFTVALSAPSNNVSGEASPITGSPLTVAITDDDAVTVAFSAAAQSVGENAGTVTVTATRTGSTTFAIDVPFTVSGTAANPADHDAVSGTITIPAAAASADYTFLVSDDALDEADETVVFTMGTPTGGDVTAAAPTVHTVTVTDDDAVTVAFSAAAQSVAENAGLVTVTAARTGATTFAINVPFTVSGTAGSPADHNAVSGSITIPAASANGSYTFTVANDVVDEASETVVFTMGTPTGGDVTAAAPTVHTVTITDNDAVTVAFSSAAQSVAESAGTVTVTAVRTGATTFAINVPFTVSGTAANPADHNAVSGSITIAAASASGSYTFTVADDAVDEADETVVFTMGTPTGGDVTAAAPSVQTVTIADDESVVAGNEAPAVVVTYTGGSVNVAPASEQGGGGALSWPALAGLLGLFGLRRRRAVAAVLALAGFSTGAFAQGLSYDNADLRFLQVSVDEPSVDASGIALAGSWSVSKQAFVSASYATVETDDFRIAGTTGSSATDSISLGVGGHRPIEAGLDVTGGVSVVWAKAEGQGGFSGSTDDIGYGAEVGFRGAPTKAFEWGAALSYVAIFDDGAAGVSVQGLYHLGPRFSFAAGGGINDDSTQFNLGVRYGFAKPARNKKPARKK